MIHYIMSPNTRICYWHDINLCDQNKVFIEINLLMSKLPLLNRAYRQLNIPKYEVVDNLRNFGKKL